jgi:hypothetical protein
MDGRRVGLDWISDGLDVIARGVFFFWHACMFERAFCPVLFHCSATSLLFLRQTSASTSTLLRLTAAKNGHIAATHWEGTI